MDLSIEYSIPGICGMPWGLCFVIDGFRLIYACIATFMWVVSLALSSQYMKHYERKARYYFFFALTYIATVAVFLSADLYTLFIFFEAMSLSSYVWVAFDERKASLRAADTYLAISIIGGLTMLMGLFLIYDASGQLLLTGNTLKINELADMYIMAKAVKSGSLHTQIWAGGFCMLVGFGAKAGAFPLHIWLPKAHPVAPAPASALLSGILTKTGILGILMLTNYIFAGNMEWGVIILTIGVLTMIVGSLPALTSTDLKRTLACSSVAQIGFIMTGIGVGSLGIPMGTSGAFLHMVGHSIFKLILFSAAGVIYMNAHKLDLESIRGFGRKKPLLNLIFLSGSLGIAGVPMFNGYISKTLIHEGIVEAAMMMAHMEANGMAIPISAGTLSVIEWIFVICGGCTAAYMLKLYICIFVEKNSDPEIQAGYDEGGRYMNNIVTVALAAAALIPPTLGITAQKSLNGLMGMARLFLRLPSVPQAHFYSWESLRGGLISLAIGVVLYIGVIRTVVKDDEGRYSDPVPAWLDLEDLVYRPVLMRALPFLCAIGCRVLDTLVDITIVALRKTVFKDSRKTEELKEGTWLTHMLGTAANKAADIKAYFLGLRGKKASKRPDYVHRFALDYTSFKESRTVIYRSLSFGLLLFCMGLVLTVAYILITRWW